MAGYKWTDEELELLRRLRAQGVTPVQMQPHFPGRSVAALKTKAQEQLPGNKRIEWLENHRARQREARPQSIPSANRDIGQLLADRASEFDRKRRHHQAKSDGVTIELPTDEPFVVACIGDPHADDPGTDIEHLAWVLGHCHAEGVYPLCIGDLTNNWVGRLARLFAHQTTTDDEAIELMRWLLSATPWAFVILGNHDRWGPVAALVCQELGVPYASHGAVLRFQAPGGFEFLVDARHDHRGNSMYAAEHGQNKSAYRGNRCDLIVGGHRHVSASAKRANGVARRLYDTVRVGAFKRYDEWAESLGFDHDDVGPAAYAVVWPGSPSEAGRCVVHWDLERAIRERESLK